MKTKNSSSRKIHIPDWEVALDFHNNGTTTPDLVANHFGISTVTARALLKDPSLLGEDGTIPEIPSRAVRYFTISKGPKPKTVDEYKCASGMKSQVIKTTYYSATNNIELIEPSLVSFSTGKKTDFFSTAEFQRALEIAEKETADILMCGAFRRLARFSLSHAEKISTRLRKKGIDLIDCDNFISVVYSNPEEFVAAYSTARKNFECQSYQGELSAMKAGNAPNNTYRGTVIAKFRTSNKRKYLRPKIEQVIEQLSVSGKISFQKISDELNRQGIRTVNGKEWSKGTVAHVLKKLEINHRI